MAYLLDSDVFIQAKDFHYGFDFCPAFWEWLARENSNGIVFSIEKVADEINAGSDDLSRWAAKRGDRFFLKPDSALGTALGKVSGWASTQGYKPAAISAFLQAADYFLVAYALAHAHTVVTHEVARNSLNSIKIPDACLKLGISCITPFVMLRRERARFVLKV